MVNTYMVGSLVRFTAEFTSQGVLADPSDVTLKVKDPAGTVSTYLYTSAQVTKDSTGLYHKDIEVDSSGEWDYRFTGSGAVVAASEGTITVEVSRVI